MKNYLYWPLLMGTMTVLIKAGSAFSAEPIVVITNEPALGTEIESPVDGAIMVYVPSGEFAMGLDESDANQVAKDLGYKDVGELWAWESYPKHKVYLPGYFVDKYEVTVMRWAKYIQATGYQSKFTETSRHFGKPEEQLLPAGEIKWEEAKAYAAWAGKALLSEAQWEKAARGTDGRLYPWGNEAPTLDRGHFGEKGKQPPLYVNVGSFAKGASPYGAMDMLGNQYEWTSEIKKPYPGNPMAAKMMEESAGGKENVCLRGGSWYHGWISFYAAKRFGFPPDVTYYHVGFRTVWAPPEGYFKSSEFRKMVVNARNRREPQY